MSDTAARASAPRLSRIVQRLEVAQKPNTGAGAYSRWINRPLGRRLAALAYLTGRTPNQITVLSGFATFMAFALIACLSPRWWAGALIGGLMILGYGLDAADGQLARLRGGGSPAGEWLDHTVDAVKMGSVHLAVLVSFWRFTDAPSPGQIAVPLVFQAASSVFFFTFILMDQLRRARGGTGRALHSSGRIQAFAAVATDYGVLCLVMLLIGLPTVFIPVYTVLCGGFVIVLIGALGKWWTEVRSWA